MPRAASESCTWRSIQQAFGSRTARSLSRPSASYTMSTSTSDIGSASDETDANLVQDISNPFGPVQDAPSTRSDARHRTSLSAIVEGPAGIDIAPIFLYRSGLPTHTFEGLDR